MGITQNFKKKFNMRFGDKSVALQFSLLWIFLPAMKGKHGIPPTLKYAITQNAVTGPD